MSPPTDPFATRIGQILCWTAGATATLALGWTLINLQNALFFLYFVFGLFTPVVLFVLPLLGSMGLVLTQDQPARWSRTSAWVAIAVAVLLWALLIAAWLRPVPDDVGIL